MTKMDFPTDVAEFGKDPRISFSKNDDTWLLETQESEWLWDKNLNHWRESIDEELVRQHQESFQYKGPVTETQAHPRDRKKRKKLEDKDDESKAKKPRVNHAVWVTLIPLDATLEEIRDTFAKYGMIAETLETGKPRIKMYCDSEGKFKGEALIVYHRPESVPLSIQMLDDTDFRWGVSNPLGKMRVEEADSSYKREQAAPNQLTRTEKKRRQELIEKMRKKLADWSDDDEHGTVKKFTESDKFVVLKHMFRLEELEKDPAVRLDIEMDIHTEASRIGEVTKVVLYDEEPEGIVNVRFKDPKDAIKCVKAFNGRAFGGAYIVAYIWDGKEKFKKFNHKKAAALGLEDDEAEVRRLENFGAWLEGREENHKGHQPPTDSKNEDNAKNEANNETENHDKTENTDKTADVGKN